MTQVLEQEGLAAQLYLEKYPHGPLWHVIREDQRERWRRVASAHMEEDDPHERSSWHIRSIPRFVREHFVRLAFEQKKSVGEVLTAIAIDQIGSTRI